MMEYTLTKCDFGHLFNTSMRWGEHWKRHDCRFEVMFPNTEVNYKFKYAYWLDGDNYAQVIFAKQFLTLHGYEFQVMNDTACCGSDGFCPSMHHHPKAPCCTCSQWLILTDYPHDWK